MSDTTFDGQGHVVGCPAWADLWEEHFGRSNLDARTLRNLDEMRTSSPFCLECAMPVAMISINHVKESAGLLPAEITGIYWTDTQVAECRVHLLDPSWASAVDGSDALTGIVLTGEVDCLLCRETVASEIALVLHGTADYVLAAIEQVHTALGKL